MLLWITALSESDRQLFIKTAKKPCFDTVDPLILETPIEYDALHDKHLKEYFQHNPLIVKKLIRLGMVTAKGHVKCTLAQLNKYRVYMNRLYNCLVNKDRANEVWISSFYIYATCYNIVLPGIFAEYLVIIEFQEQWRSAQHEQWMKMIKCELKIMRDSWAAEMARRRAKAKADFDLR